jgi:hypothetical protein
MSTVTRTMVAILIGAAIAPVVPAVGQTDATATRDRAGASAQRASGDPVVLRRDGDRAVPVDPVIGSGEASILPRDGSQAVPFVAEVGRQAAPAEEGFDWADAAIGAAGAVGLMLLASTARAVGQRRRESRPQRTVVA